MRTLLLIDETYFFHPNFARSLFKNKSCDFVASLLVKKIPKKNSLTHFLKKNILKLYLSEIVILVIIKVIKGLFDNIYSIFKIGSPQSVKNIIKYYNIKFLEIDYSLDCEKVKNFIVDNKIELILSSNPLYIPKIITEIKNLVIVNRHSSYLPHNGGVWPVFYSISNQMDFTGVTIHLVNDGIDTGKIIYQKKINLFNKNLYDIYEKCFIDSEEVFLKSLDILKNKNFEINTKIKNKIFYNTYPKKKDWVKFRKNGGKFVEWKNLIQFLINFNKKYER